MEGFLKGFLEVFWLRGFFSGCVFSSVFENQSFMYREPTERVIIVNGDWFFSIQITKEKFFFVTFICIYIYLFSLIFVFFVFHPFVSFLGVSLKGQG